MNITLENKIKILEYKLIFEQEKKVFEEFESGSNDLNYRLSFFKQSIDKTKMSNHQQQKLYNSIFDDNKNLPDVIDLNNEEINSADDQELMQNDSKKNNNIDNWLKKLYIRISKSIHPDITMHIKSKEIKDKFDDLYLIAKDGYENNNTADIIMVAYELGIDLNDEKISKIIDDPINEKKNKIKEYKSKLGWQWYHVPDENKDIELKKILSVLGFEFTNQMVEEVIKSRKPARKTGQRPEKNSVKNKKLN